MRAGDNPFRASRIESLVVRGVAWPALWDRFASAGGRGIIVGSMGSGKTAALLEARAHLRREGRSVRLYTIRVDEPRPSIRRVRQWASGPDAVLLIDGYDLLGWSQRALLRGVPILAAGHRASGLPVLWRFETTPALLRELIEELLGESVEDYAIDVERLWQEHEGDVRAVFGALYRTWSRGEQR